jgi:hypothetical protein
LAQCEPLPNGGFTWESHPNSFTEERILKMDNEQQYGHVLEVDLAYPPELHKAHNHFPLAPEHLTLTYEDLSQYAKDCLSLFRPHHNHKYSARKLIATLGPKRKYVVHYMNLKLYLELGMKLEKVHRVISFKQERVLKPYIELCTSKRMQSKTAFEKQIWKFFSNSVFGKTIQNCRKHTTVRLCRNDASLRSCISNPRFKRHIKISDDLAVCLLQKHKLYMNSPYPIGFTILERSKEFMYRMYYKEILPRFEFCRLLFSDTDSLTILTGKVDGCDRALDALDHIMEYSNYAQDDPRFNDTMKNKLGKFKDEAEGQKITHFVGIRAKAYCMKILNRNTQTCSEKSALKGVKKSYRKGLTFNSFLKCIFQKSEEMIAQCTLVSKKHEIFLTRVKKLAMSSFDDKRYLLPCGVHSLAYNHHEIADGTTHICEYCGEDDQ